MNTLLLALMLNSTPLDDMKARFGADLSTQELFASQKALDDDSLRLALDRVGRELAARTFVLEAARAVKIEVQRVCNPTE